MTWMLELPPRSVRESLRVGSLAELSFVDPAGGRERLWVQIIGVVAFDGGVVYRALLKSAPALIRDLREGDLVEFGADHNISVVGVPVEETAAALRRDSRLIVVEAIGCALASLARLNHVWQDENVRKSLTQVREQLSVTQFKVRERIDR